MLVQLFNQLFQRFASERLCVRNYYNLNMYSYEAEQKKLQSFMDETFDMSDEDLADPLADNSEDEYVPSENESERSDDDDTPVRKMQKTEHLPTTSTKISNLYSDTIEAVVADYGDISSPEDYSEDEAAPGDPLKSRLE